MTEENRLPGGTRVKLKNDPGRQGVLTGKCRSRADTLMYQVGFHDGGSYQPEHELEVISDDNSDPYTLLEEGKFGRATDLRRNLSHIQLSGRLANLVYSMDITNTDFYAYQFKPVLSFLESPSNGLLIADEVGLGKTIEAGLIWTELRARYDARRLVVICPAMLREKWRDELSQRFNVDATIMNAKELLEALRSNRHNDSVGKGIICSMDGLRPPRNWDDDEKSNNSPRRELARFMQDSAENEPGIDLLIVDEAHKLRNPESQTAKLGQLLRGISDHVVLLSATPVNLRNDDLFHLLNLVDPDSFDVKEVFPQVLLANEPLQQAKDFALDKTKGIDEIKELLSMAQEHDLLSDNLQLKALVESDLGNGQLENKSERVSLANKIERINLLRHVVSRTRKTEVIEWRVIREPYTEFIDLNEQERDFYQQVTSEVRQYALERDISEGFMLASPQRQVSSCMYAAAKAWQSQQQHGDEQIYEDLGIDAIVNPQTASPLIDHINETVIPYVDLENLRANDTKYQRFSSLLLTYLKEHPKEKVIVFSYFRGTLSYLSERLSNDDVTSQVLVGGMEKPKQEIINEFRESCSMQVLLSSEVASEGVDLQFCRVLINYDLPWNPMKIEQRIGRIDRIGQCAEKISIWNLCYANTIDHRIHERLFERLKIFERALGGLEAILGENIETLSTDLLCGDLTVEQQDRRIDQTALAIEQTRLDQDALEKQASHLIAHGGYILEQVQAAHEFKKRITDQDLVVYVKDYLEKYCQGHVFRQKSQDELIFDIKLPPKTAAALNEFIDAKKLHGVTQFPNGLETQCQFLNKLVRSTRSIETINQFHPVVRFISNDLKERNEAFFPLVAVALKREYANSLSPGFYVFVVNLWTFTGLGISEELRCRIIALEKGTLLEADLSWDIINSARVNGEDWLAATNEINRQGTQTILDLCADKIDEDYLSTSRDRSNENSDRVSFQLESAKRHRQRQLDIHTGVLNTLIQTGKERLIPARRGLIRKVEERFEVQSEILKTKARFSHSQTEVCVGVISVI